MKWKTAKSRTAHLSAGVLAITLAAQAVVMAQTPAAPDANSTTSNSSTSTGTTATGSTSSTGNASANNNAPSATSPTGATASTANNTTANGSLANGNAANGTLANGSVANGNAINGGGANGNLLNGTILTPTANAAENAIVAQPVVSNTGVVVSGLADARNADDAAAPVFTLADALTLALENNPTLQSAQAAVAAAQARVGTANAAGGAQVGVNANIYANRDIGGTSVGGFNTGTGTGGTGNGGTGTGGTGTGGTGSFNQPGRDILGFNQTESAGITATVPIYTGGRVSANKRLARSNVVVQTANAQQIQQDLLLNTTTSYLNTLRSRQLLNVAASNVDVSREQLRVAQVRFDAGAAARLEVFQAQATLADAEQRRTAASATLGQNRASLNTLMGRAPETPLNIEEITSLNLQLPTLTTANGTPLSTTDLRNITIQSRPALTAAQAQITSSEANVDVAKAQRRPNVGLSLGALFRNPLSYIGRFALSLGLGLSQNVFDSGLSRSQISEAQALVVQSRAGFSSTVLTGANQIEQALLVLDSAQSRTGSADVAVTAAQEALRAAQVGYQAGVRTSLDVTTAQTALLNAQTNAVNARFDVATGQAQLASAVGVLTVEAQDAAARTAQSQQATQAAIEASAPKPKKKRKKFLGIF